MYCTVLWFSLGLHQSTQPDGLILGLRPKLYCNLQHRTVHQTQLLNSAYEDYMPVPFTVISKTTLSFSVTTTGYK